jgi:DNA-binding LytR/AlgR family response regulator
LFLRISRSILVNLERIKGLQSTPRGEYLVILQDDRQLLMTRGLKDIQARLQYPASQPGGLG